MFQQAKIRVLSQCINQPGTPRMRVVEDSDLDGRLSSVRTIPMEGALDRDSSRGSRRRCDKHAATGQRVKLRPN